MTEIVSFADLPVDSRERSEEVVFTAQKIKKKNQENQLDQEPEEEPIKRVTLVFAWNYFSFYPSRSFNHSINLLVCSSSCLRNHNYTPSTIWGNLIIEK